MCAETPQAIAMTGGLASQHRSRVTVLLVDDQPLEEDPGVARMDFLSSCAPPQPCVISPATDDKLEAQLWTAKDGCDGVLAVSKREVTYSAPDSH